MYSRQLETTILAMVSFLMFATPDSAAESLAHIIPTNLAGVTAAANPPEWFNPLTASDEEVITFGLPPRPDATAHPEAYKSWQRAMAASKQSIVPELHLTNVFHGPMQLARELNSPVNSQNWSAVVVKSSATSYNTSTSFYYVLADYVVPVASQAYGQCTGGWDYSASWVGIDGVSTNDLFQAGTESDAYCSGTTKSSNYYAWYEWVPNNPNLAMQIKNFPISPGDDIYVQVWNTSATQGWVYIVNYNTNQSVNLSIPAPSGTKLVGNSAEWVVERPTLQNGSYGTLTNYIWEYFSSAMASTIGDTTYAPSSASAILYTMYSGSSAISYPTILGTSAIQFQNEGPSR